LIFKKFLDLNGDGYVDKQEFEQVMKDKGKELNQDQIDIFNKKFQQDENAKVTYERMYFILPMSIINDLFF
jgi:Ca2+-binding EF-hand superfamily protein